MNRKIASMQIPHQRFHTRKCITKLVTSKIINNSNKWASSPSANAYLKWLFVHTCDSHVCGKSGRKLAAKTNNKWEPCYKKHNRKLVKQHISHGAKKGREKVRKRENWRIGNLLNFPKYTHDAEWRWCRSADSIWKLYSMVCWYDVDDEQQK